MDRAEIAARIMRYLEDEFPNDGVELTAETSLLDDWFIDSLAITETVLFLESSFAIDLSRADINGDNFQNVASLADLVASRRVE